MESTLNDAILKAHKISDFTTLVRLYTKVADAQTDLDAECYFLTYAYVFALENGAPEAKALNQRLVDHGREHQA